MDSATHVTIQLTANPHVVYSSDVFRLRHVEPLNKTSTPASPQVTDKPAEVLDGLLKSPIVSLEGIPLTEIVAAVAASNARRVASILDKVKLSSLVRKALVISKRVADQPLHKLVGLSEQFKAVQAAIKEDPAAAPAGATAVKSSIEKALIAGQPLEQLKEFVSGQFRAALVDIKENPAVAPGKELYERFIQAAEATADTHDLKYLLHGTADENVDSVLAEGLRPNPARGNTTRWFTTCVQTSDQYAKGAQRRVVFAVLVDSKQPQQSIFTIDRCEHHLPLFVARRRVENAVPC